MQVEVRPRRLTSNSEIDTTYYVLSVDLWSADGVKEVNLVRHSATSPSISATTSSSYPPPPTPPPSLPFGQPFHQVHVGLAGGPQYSQNGQYGYPRPEHFPPQMPPYPQASISSVASGSAHEHSPATTQSYYTNAAGAPISQTSFYTTGGPPVGPMLSPTHPSMPPTQDPRSAPSGMFTRNLIGSLCVSAFKLTDPDGALGIWFILQDLSVRTEGQFRYVTSYSYIDSTWVQYVFLACSSSTFVPCLLPSAFRIHCRISTRNVTRSLYC